MILMIARRRVLNLRIRALVEATRIRSIEAKNRYVELKDSNVNAP
jgi:hypothetical protein